MNIITVGDLASALDLAVGALDGSTRAAQIVEKTNGLITERWSTPVTPVPTSVELLAIAVASRAWDSVPGKAPLQSVTKTTDGTSKTERYAISETNAAGYGVYLTDDERRTLRGRRRRTIRTAVPGACYR